MNKSKKGFTLVEIMIVVVIIGLLAAMAIPAFQKVRENSVGGVLKNDARQLGSAAQQYMGEEMVTEVSFTIGTDGAVGTPLDDYVREVAQGTAGPGTISLGETFSMSHPQFDDGNAVAFTDEGRPE